MEKNKKIILSLILVLLSIFAFSSFCFAERDLELQYPEEGLTSTTTLPEYIRYILKFSFNIAGIAAFAVLIYGGFRYLTSAGNPGAIKDAKTWISSAIIGLVVLLCSYLILNMINPDITKIELEEKKPVTGIYLIKGSERLYYTQNVPEVVKGFQDVSLEFLSPKKELSSIFVYPEKNFQGTAKEIENKKEDDTSYVVPSVSNVKSIRFKWNLPGVYLKGEKPGEEIRLVENIPDLGRYYFKGKTKEIELKNASTTNYQAVIHENRDFEGACQVFTKSDNIEIRNFSSVTVFQRREVNYPDPDGAEIILYPLPNYQEYEGDPDTGKEPIKKETYPGERVLPTEILRLKNQVRSIIIPPGYLVILFEEGPTGTNPWTPLGTKCQVFTKSNNDLTKEPIGRCGGRTIVGDSQWDFKPCATHIAIFAIK